MARNGNFVAGEFCNVFGVCCEMSGDGSDRKWLRWIGLWRAWRPQVGVVRWRGAAKVVGREEGRLRFGAV